MVYVFSCIPRVHTYDLCICNSLELLRPLWSNKYLRGRYEAGQVDEVAQRSNLRDGFDGAFTEDGKETYTQPCISFSLSLPGAASNLPTMSSWKFD